MSPAALEGRSEVKVGCRASAEVSKRGVPSRYVCGTTVPEPDVSSVSIADEVSIAGVVKWVPDWTEDDEWKVDCSTLLAPDEKNVSSDTETADSERTGRARGPPTRPALGGGVTITSRPRVGPLDTVTGEPSPIMAPAASFRPKPNPGRASLARRRADSNSSPRSVMDVVRRNELLRLGAITRGSPGYMMVWLEIAPSSTARERSDGWRDKDPELDPESDWKSERSGMLSIGGRKVVEREPETLELEWVLALAIDRIVRIEPVGDCVSDRSGTVTERSRTSLATS